MKKKYVIYPAIIEKSYCGYSTYVPDFDIKAEGKNIKESIKNAKEIILLQILCYKVCGDTIPLPNSKYFKLNKNEVLTLVGIFV